MRIGYGSNLKIEALRYFDHFLIIIGGSIFIHFSYAHVDPYPFRPQHSACFWVKPSKKDDPMGVRNRTVVRKSRDLAGSWHGDIAITVIIYLSYIQSL